MQTWFPHSFRTEAANASAEYLDKLVAIGTRQSLLKVPVIFTLGHLAHLSETSYGTLRKIASRTFENPYETFNILKRSGGWRRICVPAPPLLRLQRWIDTFILRSPGALALLHDASHAYAPGNSIVKNASAHLGARWLVKIDVKDFFESVSERQVYMVFRSFNYPALLSFELSRICTRVVPGKAKRYSRKRWSNDASAERGPYAAKRVGHLPQGAPTSPMLANLVCRTIDMAIQAIATELGCVYTRYADDIVLSAAELERGTAQSIVRRVEAILARHGFRRNSEKTSIVSPGAKKFVTGLVVNEPQLRLPRQLKDSIRAHLYYSKRFGIATHCKKKGFNSTLGFLNHLTGLIRYANAIEPEFAKKAGAELKALRDQFPVPSMLHPIK